jgi:hypothetical protein
MQIIQTKPNLGVDKLGRGLRILGPTLIVAGVTVDIIDIAGTPEEERLRKTVGKVGGLGGSLAGASLGARTGAAVGNWIPHPAWKLGVVCVCTAGGAIYGGLITEELCLGIYDAFVDE